MSREKVIFSIIQDLFMSIVLTAVATVLNASWTGSVSFLRDIAFAWIVNLMISFGIPQEKIGKIIIRKLSIKVKWHFPTILFVIVFTNVLGISVFATLKAVGLNKIFWIIEGRQFIPLLAVGYVAAYLLYPVSNKMTNKIVKNI